MTHLFISVILTGDIVNWVFKTCLLSLNIEDEDLESISLLALSSLHYAPLWKIVLGPSIKTDQDHIDLIHCNSLAGEFFQGSLFMCQ